TSLEPATRLLKRAFCSASRRAYRPTSRAANDSRTTTSETPTIPNTTATGPNGRATATLYRVTARADAAGPASTGSLASTGSALVSSALSTVACRLAPHHASTAAATRAVHGSSA